MRQYVEPAPHVEYSNLACTALALSNRHPMGPIVVGFGQNTLIQWRRLNSGGCHFFGIAKYS
jgi:hypothetical protein